MPLVQARKSTCRCVGIVRVEPEERGASHRADRLLSIEAIISVAIVPSYFLCVEEGGDFCLGKSATPVTLTTVSGAIRFGQEGVLQHRFRRGRRELLVHFFDGVRTVSAVLSVHANTRNGRFSIGGVERNGGEVDVVLISSVNLAAGAPAESPRPVGVVRVHPIWLTHDQCGLFGWAAHVIGPIGFVYRAIDMRVRVGVSITIGMCLGDFHARILRWIVQDNVVVIWNFLFVLAVECDAAVFISPRFPGSNHDQPRTETRTLSSAVWFRRGTLRLDGDHLDQPPPRRRGSSSPRHRRSHPPCRWRRASS